MGLAFCLFEKTDEEKSVCQENCHLVLSLVSLLILPDEKLVFYYFLLQSILYYYYATLMLVYSLVCECITPSSSSAFILITEYL